MAAWIASTRLHEDTSQPPVSAKLVVVTVYVAASTPGAAASTSASQHDTDPYRPNANAAPSNPLNWTRDSTAGRRGMSTRHNPIPAQHDLDAPVTTSDAELAPYLPRLVRIWSEEQEALPVRELDGSLVSIDISGFTALAERLAVNGRAGAEELVQRISAVFDALIAVAERHGGDVLKFRGDALLLFFTGERHAQRATGAASDMQWTIEEIGGTESSVGPAELRMSGGVHSGLCHFFLTDVPHRELVVAGPAATRVFELEDLAVAGEIVVSSETAALLDPAWLAGERDGAPADHPLGAGREHHPTASRGARGAPGGLRAPDHSATTSRSRAARRSTAR